jgi:hypothetical protein
MGIVQVYVHLVQMAVKELAKVAKEVVKMDAKILAEAVVAKAAKVHALIFVQVAAQQVVRRVASLIAETTV